jgi:acyl-coenzyme A synthetase/AMP-(fatty) acid ligase
LLSAEPNISGCSLIGPDAIVSLRDLSSRSSLAGRLEELRGSAVLIATRDQLTAGLALVELDGVARRLVLCPGDLPRERLREVAATAEADALVADETSFKPDIPGIRCVITCSPALTRADCDRRASHETECILLTSGTTGMPKLALHTLSSLTGAIKRNGNRRDPVVWSTFYDIRRYGGLQIFLRACLGGAPMVLSSAEEPIGNFLTRAAAHGVTHISGTPSHWRRALMSPSAHHIDPRYVRLSGEMVDKAILDRLQAAYPKANVAHAFASTEAGVAFDVRDGLAGFPASLVGRRRGEVEMKVEDGTLRIRSARIATRYLGSRDTAIADADGFVDTGDVVELRGNRYYFVGRRDGIINVGGLKVHPEEVETVINRHPSVQMSLVSARKSSITGALVVADIVVKPESQPTGSERLRNDILDTCRRTLAPYKVPAVLRFVPSLEVAPSGKLARL